MIPNFVSNIRVNNIDNLSLLYHKYYKGEYESKDKKDFFKIFISRAGSLNNNNLNAYKKRHEKILQSLKSNCYVIDNLELKTDWRLVVGLGGESVLETSIALHPLYGFPYIPSSAVKGITRAFAVLEKGKAADEHDKKINPNSEIDPLAVKIFGKENSAGQVTFFDALPNNIDIFDLDIMNVHYDEYYNNDSVPPADWMKPIPITFVTIKSNVHFNFFLAARNIDLVTEAKHWLHSGLVELGAGGKISAGYGYFIPLNNVIIESQSDKSISTIKKEYPIAEIVDITQKPYTAKLVDKAEIFTIGNIGNPKGLGLEVGSKIYVKIILDKNKKIQSLQFVKKV
ncbi:MAG: type III-B CRISPR module RAMP protein Cmr6 [Actinobacteria bacterium]|nr:type III-B CRISPR module RAMP protein Cmr6 [Actinomycetota bacterium]